MTKKHLTTLETIEGNIDIYLVYNELAVKIHNRVFPIIERKDLLPLIVEKLKRKKRSKRLQEIIDHYSCLNLEIPAGELNFNLWSLKEKAALDEVQFTYSIRNNKQTGYAPHVYLSHFTVEEPSLYLEMYEKYIPQIIDVCNSSGFPLAMNVISDFGYKKNELKKYLLNLGFQRNKTIGIPEELIAE